MDIKDYAQMMGYLTRPRDVVPDPSTMAQEPRNMYNQGQLVRNTVDGSRPGYSGDKFLVKVGSPKKLENVIEQEFIEVIGSKNRPETYKKTGVKKTLYKPQIIVGNKTVLTTDFGTKDAATAAVEKYREKNPIKNAPPDLDTLDKQKKKKYLANREKSAKIIEREGVESFATGDDIIHKGHAQNINNPDVPIKPRNIIYTPKKINQSMAGQGANISPTDLDFKINATENNIKDIKKSNMSGLKKKIELEKLDTKLMKYVAQSDGYKTVTLSDGQVYGEIFQKNKSMDMFDEFSNMTEKETKKFVNQYFTDEGKLKDKWNKGNVSDLDKANIEKSYVFLENIKNAKTNAKQVKLIKTLNTTVTEFGSKSKKGKAALQALAILTGTTVGASASDASSGTSSIVKNAAIGGGAAATLGTKTGRKVLSNLLSAAGVPLSVGFNAIYGIDPESSLDRTILGTEAALAPMVVKDAIRVTDKIKNPLLKKVAQVATTINPKYALKAAKVLNPIGIASLAGEAIYNVGKLGYEDQKRFNALSPEEQAAERAEQEKFAFDVEGS